MTLSRLARTRSVQAPIETVEAAPVDEARSGMMTAYPSMDPAAIPPPGLLAMQRAGVTVTAHTSIQIDVVFTCLRVISNAMLKLDTPRAYTAKFDADNVPYKQWDGDQPTILHDTFGPYMMRYDGRRRTVVSLALFGEAFWYVVSRDRLGLPEAVEVLHPAFMKVGRAPSGAPLYEYGTGQDRRELPADDVVHMPFMTMPGARRGLSSIEYAGVSYALALAAMEYGQRWFSQGASPSFILSTQQKLGTEEVERIAEKFLIEHSGLTSSHLPLVVDKGLKVDKISSTPDEAQYLQTLSYARGSIADWFGLPNHMVGGITENNGSDRGRPLQEQSMQFLQWTLSAYTIAMAEGYEKLLPLNKRVAYDESLLATPDAVTLAQEIMSLRQTQVATQNEIRVRKLGMPPIEGGDNILAPLASNVAPAQTDTKNAPSAPNEPTKAQD